MKKILQTCIILLLLSGGAYAYTDIGDNLIEPRYYEGNLLIYNEGGLPYSVFSEGNYLGTINRDQGMYVNESCNYSLYAAYDEWRDLENLDIIEKKFNQWWVIIIIGILLLIVIIKIYKVII